jgi:hypothetical protein
VITYFSICRRAGRDDPENRAIPVADEQERS